MKFGEMEIHTSFDDKGGMTETEKKGGAFGTKSERLTVTDKDGGKIETEKTKDLFGTRSERLTITTEDVEAMQRFADAEADKLDNALEQSSNPEEGEKTNRFKKALKNMTIGAVLLAKVAGGVGIAESKEMHNLDLATEEETNVTMSTTQQKDHNKEESKLMSAISEVQGDMFEGGEEEYNEQKEIYKYVQERDYSKPFNVLNEQQKEQFSNKDVRRQIVRDLFKNDLGEFNKARKLGDREQYIEQLAYKYGADALAELLEDSYLGLDKIGQEREILNIEAKMNFLKPSTRTQSQSYLKKIMYNFASNLGDKGEMFKEFSEKMKRANYPKVLTALSFSLEEIQFLMDSPKELNALVQVEQQASIAYGAKFSEHFGKGYMEKPVWEVTPMNKLALINDDN